ncbi:hypothetical protein GZ78_02900 [Endozoicomonas numazuensis]|uniref:AB hydrolase-1 domain-containing protein n=1 Tax=Endozoicomonas numazuensis TaxID=1137799 RepID=A0A081NKN0_9GAMM|nr:hypothetical protein GZ78_02900 [Endozoicomonas numazuensis]
MRKQLVRCLSLLFVGPALSWAYDFPVSNPFLATVAGTPPEQQVKLNPMKVREAILGLADETVENAPDIFWDVTKPRFKLAWQEKKAPLIFIIAGTGGRFDTSKVEFLKRVYYQAGFHVIQISSPTSYDFVVSGSNTHRPGLTQQDSEDLYRLMKASVERAQSFRKVEINGWYLTGYSLGALNAAFVAQLDSEQKVFGFERVLLLNPPVSLQRSIDNLDRLLMADVPGVDDSTTLFNHFFDKLADYFRTHKSIDLDESMLFQVQKSPYALSREELALLIGVSFRLSVASMYFTSDAMTWDSNLIPKDFKLKRSDSRTPYFKKAMLCSFQCYVDKVLIPYVIEQKPVHSSQEGATSKQRRLLFEQNSLSHLEVWLKNARHVGVMHNADDFIIDQKGLDFLYDTFGRRIKIYPLGGHMGNLQYHENVRDMLGFMKGKGFPDA